MRAPAVSFIHKLLLVAAVGLLACGLALPYAPAFAEGEDAPSALLASSLMGGSASVVREDVVLAGLEDDVAPDPIIGSFTVDGLTFAITEGSNAQLVGVSPDWQQATGLQAGEGSPQPSMPASEAEGPDAGGSALLLPETVAYNGIEYSVSSIGAYAFYLSGVTSVELSASVVDVDDRAFRSSDVTSVEVVEGNPSYSSFDGALYDADQLSLLLIPEGKQGTVLLPSTAESAAPSVFSHCPLVTQIAVEEGSAAFASENGLLYDASLTTLLRVPAGATDITIREGCTTITAGAMEACASLVAINAPSSVTSISPYLFEQQPETIMAPVAVAAVGGEGEKGSDDAAPQLSALVALTAAGDMESQVDAAFITALLPDGALRSPWVCQGFGVEGGNGDEGSDAGIGSQALSPHLQDASNPAQDTSGDEALPSASLQDAFSYAASMGSLTINSPSGTVYWEDWTSVNPQGVLSGSGYLSSSWSTSYFDICSWSSTANAVSRTGDALRIMLTSGGWAGRCILLSNDNPGYSFTWTRSGGTVSSTGTSTDHHLSGDVVINVTRTPKVFKVALDKNGGVGGTGTIYLKYATGWYSNPAATTNITKVTIPTTGPDGKPLATSAWTFGGYKGTDKNGKTYTYVDASGNLKSWLTDFTSDTTLTAVWTKSVKLEREDGTGGSTSATYTKGEGFTSSITKPTAPSGGWTFLGYFDYSSSADSSNASYGPVYQFFKDDGSPRDLVYDNIGSTLYAWWAKEVTLNKYATSAVVGSAKVTKVWAIKGGKLGSTCGPTAKVEDDVLKKVPKSSPLMADGWAPTWSNAQGWAFDGYWSSGSSTSATQYIDKEGNGVIACPDDMPSTLYAQWVGQAELEKQGGSGGSDYAEVVYAAGSSPAYSYRSIEPPTTPPGGDSSGWEFLGYCDYQPTASVSGTVWQFIKSNGEPTGRTTTSLAKRYAWWVKKVTLDEGPVDAEKGTVEFVNALKGAPLGYACTTPKVTVNGVQVDYESEVRAKFPNPSGLGAEGWAPTRTGYEFGGYYDSSTGSTRYITASGDRGDAVPESLGSTIYAKWYATLTFDANGGTVSMYRGTINDKDSAIDTSKYKGEKLTVYETGSGKDPAVYAPAINGLAGLEETLIRVGFWDRAGGNNYGLTITRPGYVATGMTGTNPELTKTSGSVKLVPGGTFQAQWQPKTINITWDSNGGSKVAGTSATYSETAKVPMPASEPFLTGKKFAGWFTEKEDGKGDQVTSSTSLPTSDVTYYARWIDPASITFDANGGKLYLYTGTTQNPDKVIDCSPYKGVATFTAYETGTGGDPAILGTKYIKVAGLSGSCIIAGWWDDATNNYGLRFERPGYTAIGMVGTQPELTTSSGQVNLVVGNYCTAQWRPNRYTVAFDANGVDAAMPDAMSVDYEQGDTLPGASAQGFMFRGWNTKLDGTGDPYQPGDACDTLTQADGETVTLYAQWTPIVSADAPLDVTVAVDLLGIEDQVPASGYIESRSGGALKVAAIDFTPLDGATALFGSSTADVALEALAGERASAADVSFSLDAKATETDAAKLVAFALPDGFGTKMPIGYRFAIPEDVLASIDPARFEKATTPVCSVVYTVALA